MHHRSNPTDRTCILSSELRPWQDNRIVAMEDVSQGGNIPPALSTDCGSRATKARLKGGGERSRRMNSGSHGLQKRQRLRLPVKVEMQALDCTVIESTVAGLPDSRERWDVFCIPFSSGVSSSFWPLQSPSLMLPVAALAADKQPSALDPDPKRLLLRDYDHPRRQVQAGRLLAERGWYRFLLIAIGSVRSKLGQPGYYGFVLGRNDERTLLDEPLGHLDWGVPLGEQQRQKRVSDSRQTTRGSD